TNLSCRCASAVAKRIITVSKIYAACPLPVRCLSAACPLPVCCLSAAVLPATMTMALPSETVSKPQLNPCPGHGVSSEQ
ncbi:hypothetical protein LEMLEM_LOCUS9770, partial [Lemmus lemmus]